MIWYVWSVIIVIIILIYISYIISYNRSNNYSKVSEYECGFSSYRTTSTQISYILICILYLIFDLEISFLFPYILYDYLPLGDTFTASTVIFIIIILLGLYLEFFSYYISSVSYKNDRYNNNNNNRNNVYTR